MKCVPYTSAGTCQYVVGGGSWDCALCSTPTNTPTPTSTPRPQAWFQVENLDIHSSGEIESAIPQTATNPYLINSDYGGIVSSKYSIRLGLNPPYNNPVSPNSDWKVKYYPLDVKTLSFEKLRKRTGVSFSDKTKEFSFLEGGSGVTKVESLNDLSSGVWYSRDNYDGDPNFVIDKVQTISGNKALIIFIGANDQLPSSARNLVIKKNILITDNSTLVFIVSKDINIDPEVTEIHGIYYSPGDSNPFGPEIHTGHSQTGNDQQLKVYGSLIAAGNSTLYLERDLGETQNKTTPSELIIGQAKYFLPPLSSFFHFQVGPWQEVAP